MNRILMLLWAFCLASCGQGNATKDGGTANSPINKHLNITVVLDLSDRITKPDQPSHTERDLSIIHQFIEHFKADVLHKNALQAKGKFRVVVKPEPASANISELLQKLNYDFANAQPNEKKLYYKDMDTVICSSLRTIYEQTLASKNWIGSDIWRFFKDDAEIYLENDTLYRNIFVVLTDGYIYHQNSQMRNGNRYSYLTQNVLAPYRNQNNFQDLINQNDFGMIANKTFDENMEVLFMELNPTPAHETDFDILKLVLCKWCEEMGINKSACYRTSPNPNQTNLIIQKFLQ